jgi:hypothetical protein
MDKNELVEVKNEQSIEPIDVVNYGHKAANLLNNIISKQKDKVMIGGKQYLQFQDWQTIAKFYNTTVLVEWANPIIIESKVVGYESKANAVDKEGRIISSAISSCSRDENTWKSRPDFQIRSMAQTRACVKALRNIFSWVVVLAGYQPVAAEEMEDTENVEPKNVTPKPGKLICVKCQTPLTDKVFDYSFKNYGMALCFKHQKEFKKDDLTKEYEVIDTFEEDEAS